MLSIIKTMDTSAESIISYKADSRNIVLQDVGGKGWNLFRLHNIGFPVPPWFVISSQLFSQLVDSKQEAIGRIIATTLRENGSLEITSTHICEMITSIELPEKFLQGLSLMLDELSRTHSLFSVRSSVVDEDSVGSSFAGQMDSFLNVPRADVASAVIKVWASAFSSRALLYRKKKELSMTNISAAVIVQSMVQADSSGILFTRDPETRAKLCIIAAGYGLGEGVVANLVETDTYKIDWHLNDITTDVRVKGERVALNSDARSGTRLERLHPLQQTAQVLRNDQILLLRDVGLKAEAGFGFALDIEWAFDSAGTLFVLQARPIVFSPSRSTNVRIWDNSNIVESYPGLTLPLTFTFVRGAYERAFQNAARQFIVFKKSLKKSQHIFKDMIGLLDGRVYYNLLNWYEMLSYLPGFQRHKKSWDLMIGISKKVEFPQNKLTPLNRFLSFLLTIWRLAAVRSNANRFFKHFRSKYLRFNSLSLSSSSEDELITFYRSLEESFLNVWHLTLVNDFCAMKYYDWLKSLCSKWGLAEYVNLHNNLLCGESGIESVAPVRSLVRLAQMVGSNEENRLLLSATDSVSTWRAIQCEPRYLKLKEALNEHLERFGDRGLEELKLETPTFRDNPAQLLGLVRSYVLLGLSVEAMELQEQSIRSEAEKTVRRQLKNPFLRLFFGFVLGKARFAVASRENMRFARSRVYGIARRIFRRIGELFVQKGLIKSSDDIYYLTLDEVFEYVEGTATTQNLRGLIDIRKKEYEVFAQRTLKDRIETTDSPYLNQLSFSEEASSSDGILQGVGCSSGVAQGKARVVLDPRSHTEQGEHILVAKSTDPGWVFLMISSKGIVVERGSVLSHTAIIGRELGIPTIVGVKDATKRISNGAEILINGSTGVVQC